MTQNWTDDVFASSHNAQTDLQNMENNFQTLKSLFSGSSAPPNAVAGMPWFETDKDLLRVRNAANASWYGLMHGDSAQKLWVYRNSAMNGWVVDSAVADKVLAIKGGSQAYNVSAGQTAGTWQQAGHAISVSEMPPHDHGGNTGGNTASNIQGYYRTGDGSSSVIQHLDDASSGSWSSTALRDASNHSHGISNEGGGNAHDHGSTWRPAAAVGTLQRMDV
jgi:hypothetical protein